jgi:hypothetical protein
MRTGASEPGTGCAGGFLLSRCGRPPQAAPLRRQPGVPPHIMWWLHAAASDRGLTGALGQACSTSQGLTDGWPTPRGGQDANGSRQLQRAPNPFGATGVTLATACLDRGPVQFIPLPQNPASDPRRLARTRRQQRPAPLLLHACYRSVDCQMLRREPAYADQRRPPSPITMRINRSNAKYSSSSSLMTAARRSTVRSSVCSAATAICLLTTAVCSLCMFLAPWR